MSKKSLGRGLEHLFDQNVMTDDQSQEIQMIDLEDIVANPYQPRKNFDQDSLNELANSIKEQGVFQPILIRQAPVGFQIISGERRYRASKLAKIEQIPAIIYDYTDQQMMEVAIIENIQREDLTIVEEARSYKQLIDNLNITQQQLADKVGKSRSHVANILRILTLDSNVLEYLNQDLLTLGHVKVLINISDENKKTKIIEKIIEQKLTVRETEKLAQQSKGIKKQEIINKSNSNIYIKEWEKKLREKTDAQVKISGKEKGKITINFNSKEDLQNIMDSLNI